MYILRADVIPKCTIISNVMTGVIQLPLTKPYKVPVRSSPVTQQRSEAGGPRTTSLRFRNRKKQNALKSNAASLAAIHFWWQEGLPIVSFDLAHPE